MEEISAPTSVTPTAEEEIISPKMAEYHQVTGSPSSFDMMVAEPEAQMSHHPEKPKALIYAIFFGCFLSSIDEALMISTYSSIASELHQLTMGSWLLIAYNFGSCVAQPVYGALYDLYGGRKTLLGSYIVFLVGCFSCGVSSSLVELAFARIVAGIGGAGMVSLTSIIITDVIPPEEIALYDGYSSTVNMIGRSLGPPLGGLLSQTIGWRLSFLGQVPFIIVSLIALEWGSPAPLAQLPGPKHQGPKKPSLNQVDTAGLLALSLAIAALSFLVEQLAMPNPEDQSSLITFGLLAATVAFSVGFGLIERFWATNPLIPVDLMMGQFGRWCVIELLIYTGRGGLLCLLTPYLIRVENWPDVGASIAFVGNALGISAGGLVAGHMVKRTKKYKNLGVSAICLSIFAYFLIWFQWRDGCSILEASIPTLLGLGTGMTYTATFIGMTATTPKDRLPVCIVTLELFLNVGFIVGPAISTAVVQKVFAKGLANSLPSDGASAKSSKVINGVLNDAMFAQNLNDGAKDIVRARYLDAFQFAPLFAVVCGVATLVVFSLSKVASIK